MEYTSSLENKHEKYDRLYGAIGLIGTGVMYYLGAGESVTDMIELQPNLELLLEHTVNAAPFMASITAVTSRIWLHNRKNQDNRESYL
ncbi:hypothetical protein HQ545_07050 [Candidatus Woesearchaeota archaeon]|nr:hypothetical protein [Candidatus Woesearchaeota archaeon]